MAGGWNTGLLAGNLQAVGSDLTSSGPSPIATGSTAYTKGAWTQLVGATTNDASWVIVQASGMNGGGWTFAYDLAIGASGQEVPILQNLVSEAYGPNCTTVLFPMSIRAGTRLSARASSNNGFDTAALQVICLDDSALSAGSCSGVDTYGFNSATNCGVAIDPGATANTKGAWNQISASVSNDLAGFFLCFDSQALSSGSNETPATLVDVGVGTSGSEKVVLPNFALSGNTASPVHIPDVTPYIPVSIKAGSRIAVRAQCRTTTSPDRTFGATFYGVRQ